MGKIYALCNQKGGVSKTTTAVNLGAGLARAGHKVLVVDVDPQANATYALTGQQYPYSNIYHVIMQGKPITDIAVETSQAGLWLAPSDIDLAGAERELPQLVGPQTRLQAAVSVLDHDYILIDSPPSLGYLTLNCLAAADGVIIPVDNGPFALRGIAHLEQTISDVQTHLQRPDLSILGVLCTQHDYTNLAKDIEAAIRERFGGKVFDIVIPKNVKLGEAHSRAKSIFDYASDSSGASAYQQLTQEVINRGN